GWWSLERPASGQSLSAEVRHPSIATLADTSVPLVVPPEATLLPSENIATRVYVLLFGTPLRTGNLFHLVPPHILARPPTRSVPRNDAVHAERAEASLMNRRPVLVSVRE